MARGPAPAALWFIVCLLLSFLLIAAPITVKHGIATHIGPVLFFPASRAVALIGNVATLLKDNRDLRLNLARQMVDRARIYELEGQNQRLRQMLELRESTDFNLVAGLVVARPGHFGSEYLLIDAGDAAGLKEDQGVLSIEGLVGSVVEVEPNRALIRTLLNSDSRVSVLIARTGAAGILSPDRAGMFQINDIPIETKVMKGDTVITSGFGGIFPPGLNVGKVVAVDDDLRLLVHRVRVRPLVHFARVREVFAIVGNSREEQMDAGAVNDY